MKRITVFVAALFSMAIFAQNINLPAPDVKGGKPLMQCFKERQTIRKYSGKALTDQQISNLLFAACGVNRPEDKKLVIPTARNWQDLSVYIVLPKGIYLYDSFKNVLILKKKGDFRAAFGMQKKMFASASAVLVYVSDFSKLKCKPDDQMKYASAHVGYAQQDVYLYCASTGLGSVAIGMVNQNGVKEHLPLAKGQKVLMAQLVGTLQ